MHSSDSDFHLSEEKTVCPEHLNDIDVPPTLVSFAVDVATEKDIITPELKAAGNKLVWMQIPTDEYDVPEYAKVMDAYGKFTTTSEAARSYLLTHLDRHGIVSAVSKMAFGNQYGCYHLRQRRCKRPVRTGIR